MSGWLIILLCCLAAAAVIWGLARRRRRVVGSPLPAEPVECLAAERGGAGVILEPRPHHYAFAHRFLTSVVLDDPRQAHRYFFSPTGAAPLRQMWDFVGSHMEHAADVLPAGDLRLSWHALDGQRKLVVVTLPEPLAMTEAHFVGLVFEHRGEQDWRCTDYYTLELSMDLEGGSTFAILCGWTKQGHLNFGTIVPAEEEAFVRAVKERSGPACVN